MLSHFKNDKSDNENVNGKIGHVRAKVMQLQNQIMVCRTMPLFQVGHQPYQVIWGALKQSLIHSYSYGTPDICLLPILGIQETSKI